MEKLHRLRTVRFRAAKSFGWKMSDEPGDSRSTAAEDGRTPGSARKLGTNANDLTSRAVGEEVKVKRNGNAPGRRCTRGRTSPATEESRHRPVAAAVLCCFLQLYLLANKENCSQVANLLLSAQRSGRAAIEGNGNVMENCFNQSSSLPFPRTRMKNEILQNPSPYTTRC